MDKFTDTTSSASKMGTQNTLSNTLLEATSALALNLVQSEPFLRLREADRKLHEDKDAIQLLTDASELQQKIRKQQHSTAISESDLKRLRELHSAIDANTLIQENSLTQETAIAFLREVNQEISNLIGIDFASLARRSGGCC